MSYILEALRKADAERERGTVPDLHAQLLPGAPMEDDNPPPRGARWLWPAVGATALGVMLAGWFFLGSGTGPDSASPTVAQAPPLVQAPPTSAASVPASASTPAASSPSAPASPSATPSARAPAAAQPSPAQTRTTQPAQDVPRADQTPDRAASPAATAPRAQSAPAKAAPAAARTDEHKSVPKVVAAPPPRVPPMSELPEELRRQLPTLAIGGSVYSPQAAKRMVIVNGQVFQEGATLAPELLLEQVRPKSAVFSIRGQRFEMPL